MAPGMLAQADHLTSGMMTRPKSCSSTKARRSGKVVKGGYDLLGFGAGAVVGMDVNPPDSVAGIEDDGGGHRQGDGAVGVDPVQVESELQLGARASSDGCVRMPRWPAMMLQGRKQR